MLTNLDGNATYISALPVEILTRILGMVPVRHLPSLRRVSRYFDTVIQTDPSLRYSIELLTNGYAPAHSQGLSVQECREKFNHLQRSWEKPMSRFLGESMPITLQHTPSPGSKWRNTPNGFLGIKILKPQNLQDAQAYLEYIDLADVAQNLSLRTNVLALAEDFETFDIDPSQDLIAIITPPPVIGDPRYLVCLSLQSGLPHPLCCQNFIEVEMRLNALPSDYPPNVVNVSGEFLIISYGDSRYAPGGHIWVHWPSGIIVKRWDHDSRISYDGIRLLESGSCLVIVTQRSPHGISIHHYKCDHSTLEPLLMAIYCIPTPGPVDGPNQLIPHAVQRAFGQPFSPTPSVIGICFIWGVSLIAPVSMFLSCANTNTQTPLIYPWQYWDSDLVRFVDGCGEGYITGYRVVSPEQIFDFRPNIAREKKPGVICGSETTSVQSGRDQVIDISTSRPYREVMITPYLDDQPMPPFFSPSTQASIFETLDGPRIISVHFENNSQSCSISVTSLTEAETP